MKLIYQSLVPSEIETWNLELYFWYLYKSVMMTQHYHGKGVSFKGNASFVNNNESSIHHARNSAAWVVSLTFIKVTIILSSVSWFHSQFLPDLKRFKSCAGRRGFGSGFLSQCKVCFKVFRSRSSIKSNCQWRRRQSILWKVTGVIPPMNFLRCFS